MKNIYETPSLSLIAVSAASFLASSAEAGDAMAVDRFTSTYGESF